ncbi:MAG TPA: hypothetical protein VFE47_15470 [Tepidisphaeraceae bacterium]|jgi:hypothetical protein|nr:hypothetical protein [Tepidisphaeraceae bacterium]
MQQDASLQSVPRPLDARVRFRAWIEPRVRFWWLLAIVLCIIGVGFMINGIHTRYHEAWLIRDGLHIESTVMVADGEPVKGRPEKPGGVVQIQFPWNGADYQPQARVLEGRKEWVTTGSPLWIHVNPKDPEDWTWLNEPLPAVTRMIGAFVVIPIALLTWLWTIFMQRKTLRVWREGTLAEALIVESRHIAVAPRCRAAQVTPADEADQRVFTVYLPPSLAGLRPGDALMIIRPPGSSLKAVAAAWFD